MFAGTFLIIVLMTTVEGVLDKHNIAPKVNHFKNAENHWSSLLLFVFIYSPCSF